MFLRGWCRIFRGCIVGFSHLGKKEPASLLVGGGAGMVACLRLHCSRVAGCWRRVVPRRLVWRPRFTYGLCLAVWRGVLLGADNSVYVNRYGFAVDHHVGLCETFGTCDAVGFPGAAEGWGCGRECDHEVFTFDFCGKHGV